MESMKVLNELLEPLSLQLNITLPDFIQVYKLLSLYSNTILSFENLESTTFIRNNEFDLRLQYSLKNILTIENQYLEAFLFEQILAKFYFFTKQYSIAFDTLFNSISALLRLPQLDKNSIPLLTNSLEELYLLANDIQIKENSQQNYLERYSQLATRCAGFCCNDRNTNENSRKWATYSIINGMLRFYIKKKQHHLIRSVLRLLETCSIPLNQFPMSQQVTFNYYLGIYTFYQLKFKESLSYFNFALKNCPNDFVINQRKILDYLIPLQLNMGVFPSESLLIRFPNLSKIYLELKPIYLQGLIGNYKLWLQKNQAYFNSKGLIPCILNLEIWIWRNLIHSIYYVLNKNTRLPLNSIQIALKLATKTKLDNIQINHINEFNSDNDEDENEFEFDEIVMRISTLIHKDIIKGYLSHAHRFLVLSKVTPFPTLTELSSES